MAEFSRVVDLLWRAHTYDHASRLIDKAYLGLDGKPALHPDGNAGWSAVYDPRGHQTEFTFWGKDRKPIRIKAGYARIRKTYDPRGNLTETAYFGPTDQPVMPRGFGYAKVRQTYDERCNCTCREYFDTHGQRVLCAAGYASRKNKHDPRGNVLEEACFGLRGQPIPCADGYARIRWTRDDRDQVTDAAYLDEHGHPLRVQVVVVSVEPGQQAQKQGLRPGDVLVTYDGREIVNRHRFDHRRTKEKPADGPRELRVLRGGKPWTCRVKPGPLGAVLRDRVAQ